MTIAEAIATIVRYREKGSCEANRGIAAPELEVRVLGGVRDLLLGKQELVDAFAAEFKRKLKRLRKKRHGTNSAFSGA